MKSRGKFTSFARVLFAEAPEAAPKVPKMSVPHRGISGKSGKRGAGEACVAVTQCVVHLTRLTQRAQPNEFECFRNSLKWPHERAREGGKERVRERECVFVSFEC